LSDIPPVAVLTEPAFFLILSYSCPASFEVRDSRAD